MAPEIVYPLYGATYHIHRLSPLYHFSPSALPRHAHTLHNLLRGEVLRGVRIGLGDAVSDDILARIGALQSVTWKNLRPQAEWEEEAERQRQIQAGEIEEPDDTLTTISEDEGLGNIVEIVYEKARYTALLLRDEKNEGEGDEDELGPAFSSFPLIMMRMPAALRETFLDFLSTTFDTRPSPLKLPPKFLSKSLELYFKDLTSIGEREDGKTDGTKAHRILRELIKDLIVMRTFTIPGAAAGTLKSLDITVRREDLWPLLVCGRKLVEIRKLGTGDEGEGHPLSMAVSHHIDGQLALNLDHKSVGISRIACGAFMLDGDGKIKIHPLRALEGGDDILEVQEKATKNLLDGLIEFAKGKGLK